VGLAEIQVGDAIGTPGRQARRHQFAPPTLETVVVPRDPGERGALRAALAQLAEQDPLINVRQDDLRQEISVSLYGEVQKQVIGATLAADFGLEADFRETTTICIERLAGTGAAVERLYEAPNPFLATVGLHVEQAAAGSGVQFRIEVELGSMPRVFFRVVEDTARETLRQAGTVVCEPIHRFGLDTPTDALGPLLAALTRLRAVPLAQVTRGRALTLEGDIPAAGVHELRRELPALTRGEGVLECAFDRYEPADGVVPNPAANRRQPAEPLGVPATGHPAREPDRVRIVLTAPSRAG
jgi:ribosomal protection tetracycline resistance protein